MATSNNSNLNTHYSSTVSAVKNCLRIVVYNSSRTDYNVTRDGLDVTYAKIRQKITQNLPEDFYRLSRVDVDSSFLYEFSNSNTHGFDVIIYLDDTEIIPLGYTLLSNVQGIDKNINIILNLTSSVSGESSVDLANSFNHLINQTTTQKSFTGNNIYDYTATDLIINNLPNTKKTYTNSLANVSKNNTSAIYLGNGMVKSEDDELYYYKLTVLKNRRIDMFRVGFDHFSIGHYKNDIVLYEWKYDNNIAKYCIYSLTIKNKFGDLLSYVKTKSNWGYIEVPKFENKNEDIEILFGTGRFLVCKVDGKLRLLNTEYDDPVWVKNIEEDFIIDQLGTSPNPFRLHSPLYRSEVISKCPDLLNTFIDFEDLINKQTITLIRKIGNWYLLKQDNKDLFILAGKYNTVYLSEDEINKLIIINDSSLLIKELDYYILFDDLYSEFYTEGARKNIYNGSIVDYNGIKLTLVDDEQINESRKRDYDQRNIKIVKNTERLFDSWLNDYRKNSYPINISGIPNIVGACDGLVFYIENNNINYL